MMTTDGSRRSRTELVTRSLVLQQIEAIYKGLIMVAIEDTAGAGSVHGVHETTGRERS